MTDESKKMRIIGLKMSNVMGIKAIDMTPDAHMQLIGGRNGQGKSSILYAIQFALENSEAAKVVKEPLRRGAKKGEVVLDFGDLTVRRTFSTAASGGQLTVKDKNGKTLSSPQDILNRLTGKMGFDPIEFNERSPKEQRDILLNVVDVGMDLDEFAAKRKAVFDQRTEVGRRIRALGTLPDYDDALPAEEVSASDIIREMGEATRSNQLRADAMHGLETAKARQAETLESIRELENRLAELRNRAEELKDDVAKREAEVKSLPDVIDTTALQARLESVEETNKTIRANNDAARVLDANDELVEERDALTSRLDQMDRERDEALASAEFPVPGLSVDESGVTYNGVPYGQASSAERLKVAMAIAMASNPVIRVIHIKDGSLLDDDSLKVIDDMLREHDFQAFIERVGTGDDGAVIIEDGEIVED